MYINELPLNIKYPPNIYLSLFIYLCLVFSTNFFTNNKILFQNLYQLLNYIISLKSLFNIAFINQIYYISFSFRFWLI